MSAHPCSSCLFAAPSWSALPDFPAAPGLRNLSDEQLALLQAKLGTPITRLRNYNVRARPFYQRGLAIAALGRYSGWTPPAGVVATGVLSLTAVRASVARQPNGEPSFICFASILNESIDAILKRFNIGEQTAGVVSGRLTTFSASLCKS